ncbi:hypothetical protein CATMIT_02986, partial [Catenibacterium mitsuokai DSM 15897]
AWQAEPHGLARGSSQLEWTVAVYSTCQHSIQDMILIKESNSAS